MTRETYYVSVDMSILSISKTKTPENVVQYEIRATEQEKDELYALLDEVGDHDFEPQQVFGHPFDERASDAEKDQTQKELRQVYERIYQLGTEETRKVLDNLRPVETAEKRNERSRSKDGF
ncbi:hypothetical protein M3212_10210 [Alkalihalobacillus oceani]|uniref:hypothetical protein n=1 Tax=Halalkalibacter oceani TaxID=1653776 RepID=UPI00203B932F|nr:hypothetical protein [Halalkalibacter oceani]MCM3761154.1 hypothetical protein [Halalkalibacter oceani]